MRAAENCSLLRFEAAVPVPPNPPIIIRSVGSAADVPAPVPSAVELPFLYIAVADAPVRVAT